MSPPAASVTTPAIAAPTNVPTNGITVSAPTSSPIGTDNGIPTIKVDRGGQITYHGPGQLVVYLLFDLRRRRLGVRAMVRSIETAVIEWLDSLGIEAYGKPMAPGVYTMRSGTEAKIAALGLRVARGCTYHGLAVNIAMDLAPFHDIDPCGYKGLAVTQLAEFGVARTVEAAGAELAAILATHIRGNA